MWAFDASERSGAVRRSGDDCEICLTEISPALPSAIQVDGSRSNSIRCTIQAQSGINLTKAEAISVARVGESAAAKSDAARSAIGSFGDVFIWLQQHVLLQAFPLTQTT